MKKTTSSFASDLVRLTVEQTDGVDSALSLLSIWSGSLQGALELWINNPRATGSTMKEYTDHWWTRCFARGDESDVRVSQKLTELPGICEGKHLILGPRAHCIWKLDVQTRATITNNYVVVVTRVAHRLDDDDKEKIADSIERLPVGTFLWKTSERASLRDAIRADEKSKAGVSFDKLQNLARTLRSTVTPQSQAA